MREAFLKLLRGEPIDEIIWTADVDYWISSRQHLGLADPSWETEEGYVRFSHSLGFMPYTWYGRFWMARPVYDGVEEQTESDGPHTVRTWRTPAGVLREESLYLETSFSTAVTRYPVRSEADLRVLLYLLEHRRLEPTGLDDYPQRQAMWARYDGLPCLGMPRSPLPAFVHEWAGVQNAVYLLYDHRDLVEEILRLLEEQERPIVDAVCQAAPPLVHFPDNLTSDQFTGLFERHMAGPYRRRLERLHAAGVSCAVHLDGRVSGLLPKLAGVGMDACEALTPQPVGDVALEELRPLAGSPRLILWGGLPGAMFAPPYTWEDLRAQLDALLRAWAGQPFVVGVADQVPPNGEIDHCQRISEWIAQTPALNRS